DAGRTGQGIGAARSSLCPLRRSSRRRGLQHRRAEPAGGGAGHGERRTLPDPASQLPVNSAKSAVARPAARKFLGFSFTSQAGPRRRIAPLALARFASRVRALTRRTAGVSLEQAIDRLSIYLTGWRGYFGFCQTPELLRNLEDGDDGDCAALPGCNGAL